MGESRDRNGVKAQHKKNPAQKKPGTGAGLKSLGEDALKA